MKNTTKSYILSGIICIFALVFLLTTANTFNVFANSQDKYVAEVNSVKYDNYADAWSAVSNGGTITMLGDWTINGALTVNSNKTVTIYMNGFMINRGLSSSKLNGEVFWVKSGATLNIVGEKNSKIEHKGTIQADMWHYNANGNYTIKGALITGGYSSNGGGAIHIKDGATVNITNVTIAGNASTSGDGAGAIRLDSSNGKLIITDSEICYNKATDGGGAVSIQGEDSNVKIFGTKINNNVVTDSGENGGAIWINHGTVTVSKSSNRVSEISFNSTTQNGGAIYISNGNLILDESTIIARNNAGKEGGAIYVDDGADNVEIKGVFTGNFAQEEGGAIYVNSNVSGNNGAKISNAEFLGNRSVLHGGAIFVDSDDDITLSGKVIVNGNTPNNLYIQKQGTIISNNLTKGSRVGITTSWDATSTNPINTSNYQYFVSDKMEYEIAGNGNSIYFAKATIGAPETIIVDGTSYPVTKGVFVYNSVVGDQMPAYFYYSDAYFADSARYYNEHLVTMSSCVAIAGVTTDYSGEYTEKKGSENIVDLFEAAGFTNIYVHYPKPTFFGIDSEIISTIGFVIASKDITINGETQTLIAIAVRGGAYAAEWASNVVIGDGVGEARAFNNAANQVEKGIYEYINNYGLNTENSKFWISGFSRGGATTNLVAKRLTDKYGEDDVYAFCFEAPKGGVFSELKDGLTYANIHCLINATDIVPFVATTEMGFIRYGAEHSFPTYKVGTSEYEAQKAQMLIHLAAVDPEAIFNDYFHEATISYLSSGIFGSDLISEISSPDYKTAAEWNPVFVKKMQEYSLTNNEADSIYNKDSVNWYGYRNYWSTYKWYLYEKDGQLVIKCYDKEPNDFATVDYTVLTIEESIANVLNFFFSTDGAKKEAIMKSLDLNAIKENISVTSIYMDIIGEWNDFSIDEKNYHFNEIWTATQIENQVKPHLTPDELKTLKTSLLVILDFALDFVGDDYDETNQNLLGTMVYNISNIMKTHHYEVLNAWARSYDSFYVGEVLVAPPVAPKASLESGTYNHHIEVSLSSNDDSVKIYYTLDGSDPDLSTGNYIEYKAAITTLLNYMEYRSVTIKAIAVYNGVASEVVTYNYVVTSNAQITVKDKILSVYNIDESAYLILAEYNGDILQDIEYYPVINNGYIDLNYCSLNFENTVLAYVVKDLNTLNPLCYPVCITEIQNQNVNLNWNVYREIKIDSFNVEQAEDAEFINVTFSTMPNDAQSLMVVLYEKNSKSSLNNALYFNLLEKNESNTYTFRVKRSLLKAVLNGESLDNTTFVLVVSANGFAPMQTKEFLYKETVYTITYHLNGGINSSLNLDSFTMSDELVLYNPTREYYTFDGWYDNSYFDGSDIWVIPEGTFGNIELYAKWRVNTYTVAYVDGVDGEEVFANKIFEIAYNSKTPSFGANPTREGYNFIGWDKEVSDYVTGDVVYTAVWEKHIHTEVIDEAIAPTCTETGLTEGKHCSVCGEVMVVQTTVGALGHNYNAVVTSPDCENGGYTTYTCTVCGDTYVDDEVAALGHHWIEATTESPKTCKTCGETEEEKLPSNENPNLSLYEIFTNWLIEISNVIIDFCIQVKDFIKNLFIK